MNLGRKGRRTIELLDILLDLLVGDMDEIGCYGWN
jgi:hypothetical protein